MRFRVLSLVGASSPLHRLADLRPDPQRLLLFSYQKIQRVEKGKEGMGVLIVASESQDGKYL